GHRVRDLIRLSVEGRRAAEIRHQLDEVGVKRRNRRWPEGEGSAAAIAADAHDRVLTKVKLDLDAGAVGNHGGRQSAGRDVESRIPGMVEPRAMSQPVFACDLQVEMQRETGIAPAEIVEAGPLVRHSAFSIYLRGRNQSRSIREGDMLIAV